MTEAFEVKTGTRQGCMLSLFLFLLVINWVTRQYMDSQRTDIHWISGKILEDLEYADDMALMSYSHCILVICVCMFCFLLAFDA